MALPSPAVIDNDISFPAQLRSSGHGMLRRGLLSTLQLNLGRLCNQACEHCHVDAGPKRREIMGRDTMEKIVTWASQNRIRDVDITGGAPEMNPNFRWLVDQILELGASITSRCNLTILLEPGFEDLAKWYAERRITLVCSLPCYSESNVDSQRGKGVFEKSIEALVRLNRLGYGKQPGLVLDLVYNPGGAFLPPAQAELESDYKRELGERYGIVFNNLLALCNLPINRFARYLKNNSQYDEYLSLLRDSFNPNTVDNLMCRHLVSVDWQGYLYDCDFNQMLDLKLGGTNDSPRLWELGADTFEGKAIRVDDHCFGCTAGAGSSCGGSIA